MQKTKIEWCDITWNPVKGLCPQACWYCYARAMYKRFKWNPELRFDWMAATSKLPQKPSRIFVGSTIDLFHPQIPDKWTQWPISVAEMTPEHTFLFLTKNPARYAEFEFPKNCWLGVTVTSYDDLSKALTLKQNDNLRFVSYEPLLGNIAVPLRWVNWVIVGGLTKSGRLVKKHQAKREWIERIVDTAKQRGQYFTERTPVFLKNNLKPVWGSDLIQEWPETGGGKMKKKGVTHEMFLSQ